MKPLFPEYLTIREIKLINQSPNTFQLQIGNSEKSAKEMTVTSEVLCLLALADGNLTTEQLFLSLYETFDLERNRFQEIISELQSQNLIVDGDKEGFVNTKQAERFLKHIVFYSFFDQFPAKIQAKLRQSSVAIVGVGGIGTWLSYLLTASGVGTLHLIDGDVIEMSNLTRQMLFNSNDLGKFKVEVAKERLLALNPEINLTLHPQFINNFRELERIFENISPDIILLSADVPQNISDWINLYSVQKKIPWSVAGYVDTTGICGPLFVPGETSCRACEGIIVKEKMDFSKFPLVNEINQRFKVPSFGPLNGVVASIQAKEALMWLAGLKPLVPSRGMRLKIDISTLLIEHEEVNKDPDCPICK